MTGGAGFSRTGENAIRQNRELLVGRTLMKDNPYAPHKHVKSASSLKNYEQIKQWRFNFDRTRRRNQWKVITAVSLILAIIIWTLMTLI